MEDQQEQQGKYLISVLFHSNITPIGCLKQGDIIVLFIVLVCMVCILVI